VDLIFEVISKILAFLPVYLNSYLESLKLPISNSESARVRLPKIPKYGVFNPMLSKFIVQNLSARDFFRNKNPLTLHEKATLDSEFRALSMGTFINLSENYIEVYNTSGLNSIRLKNSQNILQIIYDLLTCSNFSDHERRTLFYLHKELIVANQKAYYKEFYFFVNNRPSTHGLQKQFSILAERVRHNPPSDAEILRAKEKLRMERLARLKFNFP
jgi:hypothetical protein